MAVLTSTMIKLKEEQLATANVRIAELMQELNAQRPARLLASPASHRKGVGDGTTQLLYIAGAFLLGFFFAWFMGPSGPSARWKRARPVPMRCSAKLTTARVQQPSSKTS